jgi:chemotaxis signal transduction protein
MSLRAHLDGLDPRVLQLSRDFDSAFAEIPPPVTPAGGALLALRVAGEPYALRASEISSLARERRVAALPRAPEGFVGLSGLRGMLLPVWDLAVLLGHAGGGSVLWQVQAADETPWALAFESFDGTLSLPLESLRPYAGQGPAAAFSTQAAPDHGRLRPVLELALLGAAVRSKILSMTPRSPDEQV